MTEPSERAGEQRGTRPQLGLALAGGGFRASLFHVGVLRRLAELDLLRRVEMISAVSGGSIVAAHFALLLKRRMGGTARNLARQDYIAIVDRLEDDLVGAIQSNLRLRLVANPLANLGVMLTHRTLGSRMVRLYEHHLYDPREDEDGPDTRPRRERLLRRRRILLRDLRLDLPAGYEGRGSLARYNAARRAEPDGSAVPALVLNATTLNSGGRFTFSTSEIGDSRLGLFRHDQIDDLLERKRLMQEVAADDLRDGTEEAEEVRGGADTSTQAVRARTLALVRRLRGLDYAAVAVSGPSGALIQALPPDFAADPLDLGWLRRAQVAARRLRATAGDTPTTGGERAWPDLLEALRALDPAFADRVRDEAQNAPGTRLEVAGLVIDVYLLRAAERVSPRIREDWERLSLGAAVGASASFPPVFPPVVLTSVYDDAFVAQLGLTDGGVYDNTGIQALVDAGCTQIIASDTGGVFRSRRRVNASRPRMMGRIVAVLRDVGADTQREALRFRRRATIEIDDADLPAEHALARLAADQGLDELVYFHISSPPVTPPGANPLPDDPARDRRALAALRTDLDSFGDVEVALLTTHGYDTADRYVRNYLPPPATEEQPSSTWDAHPPERRHEPIPADRARRVVRAGRSRFFRWLRLLPAWTWLVPGVLALAATLAAVANGISLADGAGQVRTWVSEGAAAIVGFVAWTLRPLVVALSWLATPARWPYSLAGVLALVTLVAALALWRRSRPPDPLAATTGARLKGRRLSGKAITWGRGLVGNVLWFVGFAPAVLALLGTLYATVGLAFDRLFLRLTKHAVAQPRRNRRNPARSP